MSFNKSEIMKAAWEMVRKSYVMKYGLRPVLRRCLRRAWSDAKYAIGAAERAARAAMPRTEADCIRAQISMLQNKTRWTQADYARNDALYQGLRVV